MSSHNGKSYPVKTDKFTGKAHLEFNRHKQSGAKVYNVHYVGKFEHDPHVRMTRQMTIHHNDEGDGRPLIQGLQQGAPQGRADVGAR
jgi:hypothetical protein